MKTIVVQTENGDVTVRKLALGDYAELIRSLKNLPTALTQLFEQSETVDLNDKNAMLAALPPILADAIPDFAGILAAASDKDAAFFEKECDLADSLEVLNAILELNSYTKIFEAVKKILASAKQAPTNEA